MANFNEALKWTSNSPAIYLTVKYGKHRSGADMVYSVELSISAVSGSGKSFGYPIYAQISVNNEGSPRYTHTMKAASTSKWSDPIRWNTGDFVVSNKVDGSTPLKVRLYSGSGSSRDQTWNFSMGVDPAYFTSSPSLWLISTTETTATLGWSTPQACDHVQYNINGGGWVDVWTGSATSGTYTISGLSPGTSYTIYGDFKRQDSQLWSSHGGYSVYTGVSTYSYPNYSSMANFTIGQNPTINIYNPLGRSCSVSLLGDDNSVIGTTTTSGTSVSGLADATKLYQSIPNKKSANCKVQVVYSGNTSTKTGSVYSVDTTTSTPTIASVSYQDTFADSVAITGDNQKIISSVSKVQLTATGLEAKNYATISKVDYRIISPNNAAVAELTISGTSASINNQIFNKEYGNVQDVYVRITDSRGLTYDKYIELDLLDYSAPTGTYSIKRVGNYYSNTTFLVNGNYSQIGTNALSIRTKYKKLEDSTWSNWTSLTNGTASTISLDNAYIWNIVIELSDAFKTTTYTTSIQKGMPIQYWDTKLNSTGFNCFPQYENDIEVSGVPINETYNGNEIACGEVFGNVKYRKCIVGSMDELDKPSGGTNEDFTFSIYASDVSQFIDYKMTIYDTNTGACYTLPKVVYTYYNAQININSCDYVNNEEFMFIGYIKSAIKARADWDDLLFFAEVEYLKSVG